MAEISEYERLDLRELSHRLGKIQIDDLESTQNALMILIQLIREQAQEIKILKADIEHIQNVVQGEQESPCDARERRRAQDARINELEMWRGNRPY